MNDVIQDALDYFSKYIEEIELKIAVRERYIFNYKKEIKGIDENINILGISRKRRLKASIKKTEKTLELFNIKLKEMSKEMSYVKETLNAGNYEQAILFFEQILEKWPADFISKHLSWSNDDEKRLKNGLLLLAKKKKKLVLL